VLDADEWVVPGFTREALALEFMNFPSVGLIKVRSAFDESGRIEYGESWLPRLLPRGVRYHGAIHEQPNHQLPVKHTKLIVEHDGYREDVAKRKYSRNFELLNLELLKDPDNSYLWYQLGCQHEAMKDWRSAGDAHSRSIELGGLKAPWGEELAVRGMHALSKSERFQEALELGLVGRSAWPENPDIHFGFGDLCLDVAVKDIASALGTWLPAAQASWERCLEIGERPDLVGRVVGRGSYLAAHNLSIIHQECGRSDLAEHYRELSDGFRETVKLEF